MTDERQDGENTRQANGTRFFDSVERKLTSSTDIVTQFGTVRLCWSDETLYNVVLGPFEPEERRCTVRRFLPTHTSGQVLVANLMRYFSGKKVTFEITLPEGVGNDLQRAVWKSLSALEHGQYETYGQMAQRMGLPENRARLVGNAAAQNPLPIIYPCHRVVSPTGALTGYTAGPHWKKALLELEGVPVNHERVSVSKP